MMNFARPTPLLLFGGVRDNSSQRKLRSNVRYLSSAGQTRPTPLLLFGGVRDNSSQRKLRSNVRYLSSADLPSHTVIGMPALSPTMTQGNIAKWRKKEGDKNQGNIAKWRKKEGDKIQVGDVICEIETDKATLEFECLEEGFLAKILAPEGSKDVAVGQPIAITILAPEGSKDVAVGQPIAITVEEPNDLETVKTSFSGNWMGKEEKPTHHEAKHEGRTQKISFTRISPSAKLLILEHGLDASSLTASGPRGTLTKGDVLAAIKSGKSSPKTSSSLEKMPPSPQIHPQKSSESAGLRSQDSYEDLPNSQIRKVIARRLLESKQNTPHLYLSSDVILDPLLSFRKELKAKYDVKVSVNDIVIKAVAIALRNVPEANGKMFLIIYWSKLYFLVTR
ncbi:unnamed protein product [Ilex paraguariensis]|uniref:Dihydrolipoamide acetyltransferase component of pyruvate dehydrogenase complex n=1 Tax=Ilex paraguariensis TaxID=185542 RepID=A0ABC8SQW6_9AQUA